jgi:hypothetical protein
MMQINKLWHNIDIIASFLPFDSSGYFPMGENCADIDESAWMDAKNEFN